ncbi:CHAT domain-containing protein [Akkermansiaceae bacterium]|nr:CHAT domain-containing protein [Akkermansiaceae bacterium]
MDQEWLKGELERLEANLSEGKKNRDVLVIRKSEEETTSLVNAVLREPGEDNHIIIQLQTWLYSLRARLRMCLYELEGKAHFLENGVEDFKRSNGIAEVAANESNRFITQANYAIALFLLGQQCSDKRILRQANDRLESLVGDKRFSEAPAKYHNVIHAFCLAKYGLGDISGDRGLVEDACRDMGDLSRNPELTEETGSTLIKHRISALFEVGKVRRSLRVFRSLVKILEPETRKMGPDFDFFLTSLADAKVQISRITGDLAVLRIAIGNYETVCKLLRRTTYSGRLFGALHSLALARYKLGRQSPSESQESFKMAVESGEEAFNLIGGESSGSDDRVTRILIDLATFRFALGRSLDDGSKIDQALSEYRVAQARVSHEASPVLAFGSTIGAFKLHAHQENWSSAIQEFEVAERAWEFAISDQALSHQVLHQSIDEMAGYHVEAAYCYVRNNDLRGAMEVLDRGRAQKLQHALNTQLDHERPLIAEDEELFREALEDWEKARRSGDESRCVLTWKRFSDLQRKLGIGLRKDVVSVDTIADWIPEDSVIVSIFASSSEHHAIIFRKEGLSFDLINFSTEQRSNIVELIQGDPEEDFVGWNQAYQNFREGGGQDEVLDFANWSSVVDRGLRVLGDNLMGVIHSKLRDLEVPEGTPVFISPLGQLAAFPLVNAHVGMGLSFGDHWSASVVPSLSILRGHSKQSAKSQLPHMFVVSESCDGSDRPNDLIFSNREGVSVGSHLNPTKRLSLTGNEANLEKTLCEIRGATLVHLSCHGYYNAQFPDQSGIALPSGQQLPLSRLKPTDNFVLNARVVFLSCCESGISGKTLPPDEFDGLLPAFLQCGARCAIGALWPVYDDAAFLLSVRFYTEFLDEEGNEKKSPAMALAASQAWLRTVTIRDIVEGGWFTEAELRRLSCERFGYVRLRGAERTCSSNRSIDSASEVTTEYDEGERPYRSPVDWAAFVLVGI